MLWFHAASVGEFQALVTRFHRLLADHPGLAILLTTRTRASAQALAARGLPAQVIHQCAPADYPAAMRRSLDHWRPDALIVTGVDLWPLMLSQARRAGLGMLAINTHLSPRRHRRRQRMARVNAYLFNLFDRVLVQGWASEASLRALGVAARRLTVMGH